MMYNVAHEETPAGDESIDVNSKVDVTIIQSYLYMWGYIVDEPDGLMGNMTKEALKELQKVIDLHRLMYG